MKELLLFMGLLTVLISCGRSSEDIIVEDLKGACDCAEGYVVIGNEVLDEIGDRSRADFALDEELQQSIKPKVTKLTTLQSKCVEELGVTHDEMIACDNGFFELSNKVKEKF